MSIWTVIFGVLALVCFVISVLQLREKGFLFNNAYIWASKQERETMDKKPHYRQSGIAFALITAIFLFMALECVLFTGWLWLMVFLPAVVLLVYAIVSSVREEIK